MNTDSFDFIMKFEIKIGIGKKLKSQVITYGLNKILSLFICLIVQIV